MTNLKSARGWIRAGSHLRQYEMGIDPSLILDGAKTASIQSTTKETDGFGTFMQMCKPDLFRGKRVRFSARVRTEDVSDWAGLWFRVDGPVRGESLSFDNMQDRPFKGSTDWIEGSVVLDVPEASTALAYGILLSGSGKAWIADVRIEVVGEEVATTGGSQKDCLPDGPVNLDFSRLEEGEPES